MLKVIDTIEGSGFPLGFRCSETNQRSSLLLNQEGSDSIIVECRAMGDHQKESIVTEGINGTQWRMTSDEGPYLNGTDHAPFPLGFFNIGLQADLINRIGHIAKARLIQIDFLHLELDNLYSFSGSFFKGTGQGSADGVEIRIKVTSKSDTNTIRTLINDAIQASPVFAALHTPLMNTFAIYVNGKRRNVIGIHSSTAQDKQDPFKKYTKLPSPLQNDFDQADLITKIPFVSSEEVQTMPSESTRSGLCVKGQSELNNTKTGVISETTLERPVGSKFGFKTDEFSTQSTAPSGLSYLCAGIAFCYMTQLLRYSEYLKYKISDIRMVQVNPFHLHGSTSQHHLKAFADPVDTHLFLNGEEADDVMQNLLTMGAKTCYLHAALSTQIIPQISIYLNDEVI
ncbi:hypothetical protein [Polynucleobacter kasalickyi]|nr:hypothetical protein [Polynucleobacter kasalickyi]